MRAPPWIGSLVLAVAVVGPAAAACPPCDRGQAIASLQAAGGECRSIRESLASAACVAESQRKVEDAVKAGSIEALGGRRATLACREAVRAFACPDPPPPTIEGPEKPPRKRERGIRDGRRRRSRGDEAVADDAGPYCRRPREPVTGRKDVRSSDDVPRRADQAERSLLDEKRFGEASGAEFERIARETGSDKTAVVALFNAALTYEEAGQWSTAMRVFDRITLEPRFAGERQLCEAALFHRALLSPRFLELDEAVSRYVSLATVFPSSERARIALFAAANLQEAQGKHAEAVRLYRRYATRFAKRDDSAEALHNVAWILARGGDAAAAIAAWKALVTHCATMPGVDAMILEANLRLGNLYRDRNDWKTAARHYETAVAEFDRRGLTPGMPAAAFAAQARFELAEALFRRYEKLKLSGSVAAQGKIIADKKVMLADLEARYVTVFAYKSFDWTVASFFRIGRIYQLFAVMLYDAPDPSGLSAEDLGFFRFHSQ